MAFCNPNFKFPGDLPKSEHIVKQSFFTSLDFRIGLKALLNPRRQQLKLLGSVFYKGPSERLGVEL